MKRILIMTMFTALFFGCGNGKSNNLIKTVGVEEFASIIAQEDVRLIDVRTPKEYAEGHIAGAENIDVKADDFAERIKDIKGTVAVYCRGGKRSLKAAEKFASQGCTAYNLDGGIHAWQKAGKSH
ncbi:MAG: rhodanese-like domain-containing protein [Bacteroidales bacterium]|nr:rhodanese-like domain-containing protein [Bacteroidales bacterium]